MEKSQSKASFEAVLKTLKNNKVMVDTREDGIYVRMAGKPERGECFTLEWGKIYSFDERIRNNERSNTYHFAERELSILSKSAVDPNDRPIIEPFTKEILELCDKFGKSGQSGGTAPYAANAITQALKKLLLQKCICPVMGMDEEWVNVSQYGDGEKETRCVWQNRRCGGLFKDINNKSYYLDAIIWKEENGNTYGGTARNTDGEVLLSRQYVKSFPFEPKTFYIDVVKEILPKDWTEEPFIEWDYYDTKTFEETGERVWKKEKYRNRVKDPSQLERVFKYYEKYPYSK